MKITYIGQTNIDSFRALMPEEPGANEIVLGCVEEGKPAGVIVFALDGVATILSWLYVDEAFRRRGIATELLSQASEVLSEGGTTEILCYFDKEGSLSGFLTKAGAVILPADKMCSVEIGELLSSEKCKKMYERKGKEDAVLPYSELLDYQKNACRDILRKSAYFDTSLLDPGEFDKELSFVYLKDKSPESMLLAYARDDGETTDVYVTLVLSVNKDEMAALYVLRSFYGHLKDGNFNGRLYFVAQNPRIEKMLEELLGHPVDTETTAQTALLALEEMEEKNNG